MDYLFTLFFLFIAFNMFRNFLKAAGKGAVKTARKTSPTDQLSDIKRHLERAASQGSKAWNGGGYSGDYENEDWSFGAPKAQTNKPSQKISQKPAQKISQKINKKNRTTQQGANFDFFSRNGTNVDKNRNRRDDWGRRLQKDVISGTNLFIVSMVVVVGLYILSSY